MYLTCESSSIKTVTIFYGPEGIKQNKITNKIWIYQCKIDLGIEFGRQESNHRILWFEGTLEVTESSSFIWQMRKLILELHVLTASPVFFPLNPYCQKRVRRQWKRESDLGFNTSSSVNYMDDSEQFTFLIPLRKMRR